MNRTPMKAPVKLNQRRKAIAKQSLSVVRARVKLPYKPEHLTEDELRRGLAKLAA